MFAYQRFAVNAELPVFQFMPDLFLAGVVNAVPIAFTAAKVPKVENTIKVEETPAKPEIDMHPIEAALAETEAISEINVAATDMLTPEVPAFKKYVPPAPKVPASTNGSTGYLAGVANAAPIAFTAAKLPKVANTIKVENRMNESIAVRYGTFGNWVPTAKR